MVENIDSTQNPALDNTDIIIMQIAEETAIAEQEVAVPEIVISSIDVPEFAGIVPESVPETPDIELETGEDTDSVVSFEKDGEQNNTVQTARNEIEPSTIAQMQPNNSNVELHVTPSTPVLQQESTLTPVMEDFSAEYGIQESYGSCAEIERETPEP